MDREKQVVYIASIKSLMVLIQLDMFVFFLVVSVAAYCLTILAESADGPAAIGCLKLNCNGSLQDGEFPKHVTI